MIMRIRTILIAKALIRRKKMLDQETKKIIDSARDILVGKLPSPNTQVEQITLAMLYKFMDDIDQETLDNGGELSYFTGDFSRFGWREIMRSSHSSQERMNLYIEALDKFYMHPSLPKAFRDIFKNATVPYRDPEVLTLFLKEITKFDYQDSEKLGDAYEYLLSILGSQGELGQFRTPRHIIDFMVKVVRPLKTDTILDPACGTAGFLISAYKYIVSSNENKKMSYEEKKKVLNNITGYDIEPSMVRIAEMNMYLHGCSAPDIHEYDTLTSLDYWQDKFNVILANPPFMTPKGGITPHTRFFVKSSRAEALFVDYILEHLLSHGRGGVVVPEGILQNETKDFVKVHKMLIENGLYAIVSLPVGTFNPYSSTIKTSVLFFDKTFDAKEILVYHLEHDGLDLGKNRNTIEENDLPDAFRKIVAYRDTGIVSEENKVSWLNKEQVSNNEYFSLKSRDYEFMVEDVRYESKPIGELFDVSKGSLQSTKNIPGIYTFITASNEWKKHNSYTHDCEALIYAIGASGSLGRCHYIKGKFIASDLCLILTPKRNGPRVNLKYYNLYFNFLRAEMISYLARGATKVAINQKKVKNYAVPYPLFEEQERIVKIAEERKLEISNLEAKRDEIIKKIDNTVQTIKKLIV